MAIHPRRYSSRAAASGQLGRPLGVVALVEGVDAGLGDIELVVHLDRLELEHARAREIGGYQIRGHWLCGPAAGPTGSETQLSHDLEAGARRLELEGPAEGLFGDVVDRPLRAVLAGNPREQRGEAGNSITLLMCSPR